MKTRSSSLEMPIIASMTFPIAYLAFDWNQLTAEIAIHYDLPGSYVVGRVLIVIMISILIPVFYAYIYLPAGKDASTVLTAYPNDVFTFIAPQHEPFFCFRLLSAFHLFVCDCPNRGANPL